MFISKIKVHPWTVKTMALFRQGLTPRELALSITIGLLIGVLPLFFINTPLITFLAVVLRLNLPIAVFMTYAMTPVHLLLFIPFIRIGESVLNIKHILLTFSDIKTAFQEDFLDAMFSLFWQIGCGITGWTMVAIPLSGLLFFSLWKLISFFKAS